MTILINIYQFKLEKYSNKRNGKLIDRTPSIYNTEDIVLYFINFKPKFYLIKTNSSPSRLNGAYAVAFGSKSSSLSLSSGMSGRFIFK